MVLTLTCLSLLILVASFEFRLQRKIKLLKEIERCLLISDTESLNKLEDILKSKRSKYLMDYERFTYEEYLKLSRKHEEIN